MADIFSSIWADAGMQRAVERGAEYHLVDSATYFFENASRILAPSFVATIQDVLHMRVRTTGIVKHKVYLPIWRHGLLLGAV